MRASIRRLAGLECRAAVGAGGGHQHDAVIRVQRADAVDDDDAGQVPALARLPFDPGEGLLGHAGVVLQRHLLDALARVEVADQADEAHDGADLPTGLLAQVFEFLTRVEVFVLNANHGISASRDRREPGHLVAIADRGAGFADFLVDGDLQPLIGQRLAPEAGATLQPAPQPGDIFHRLGQGQPLVGDAEPLAQTGKIAQPDHVRPPPTPPPPLSSVPCFEAG